MTRGRHSENSGKFGGRTFLICLALASFLWVLRNLEEDRKVTYAFQIELVGAEDNTGLSAILLDSIARAEVVISPWDHLLGRLSPNREPVRLKVEGLRTPRTEVPSAQLGQEIAKRLGGSARVEQIIPATLAIDVRRR